MVRAAEERDLAPPSPEELAIKLENQKERHRQSQQRYQERKDAAKLAENELERSGSESGVSENFLTHDTENLARQGGHLTVRNVPVDSDRFQLNFKNPFVRRGEEKPVEPPAPVKLLTKEEAEGAQAKLVFLFIQLSSLGDDLLEIIVKDHEPVKIWELDEDEATALAEMQLERARKDKDAARVVRVLLRIYERLYFILLAMPRAKATVSHVKAHGGFSFR